MEEREKVSLAVEKLNIAYSNQQELFVNFEQNENDYYGKLEKKKYDWQSNIDLGISHELIETIVAEEIKAFREQESFYTHLKTHAQGKQDISLAVSALIDCHRRKMNFQDFLIRWLKNSHLYGTSIARIFFKTEKGEKYFYEEESADRFIVKKKEIFTIFQPFYEIVSPYCFFIDPFADTIDEAQWAGVLRFENINILKRKARLPESKYKNISAVQTGTTLLPFIRFGAEGYFGLSKFLSLTNVDKDIVDIFEFWERTDNGIKVMEIANGTTIIREIDSPYWHQEFPFIPLIDTLNPRGFFGKSTIDPVRPLLNERKAIRDLRLENMKGLVNQTILANRYADIDFDDLEKNNKPQGLILTDDITNTFKYMDRPDILRSAYMEDEGLSKQIQSVTGIWDYLKGATPQRTETATAIIRLQQAAAGRVNIKLFGLFNAMDKLTYQHIELCRQFIKRKDVPIIRPNGEHVVITLTPPNFDFYLDVFPMSGNLTDLDIEVKRQKLLQLLALPVFNQPNINMEMLQRMVVKLFNLGEFEDFFNPMEAVVPPAEEGTPGGVPSMKGVSGTPVGAGTAPPESKIPKSETAGEG